MTMRSPGAKRACVVMVVWISVSKAWRKQARQSLWWFLGRRIRAREAWQDWQREGAMVRGEWEEGAEGVAEELSSDEFCAMFLRRGFQVFGSAIGAGAGRRCRYFALFGSLSPSLILERF